MCARLPDPAQRQSQSKATRNTAQSQLATRQSAFCDCGAVAVLCMRAHATPGGKMLDQGAGLSKQAREGPQQDRRPILRYEATCLTRDTQGGNTCLHVRAARRLASNAHTSSACRDRHCDMHSSANPPAGQRQVTTNQLLQSYGTTHGGALHMTAARLSRWAGSKSLPMLQQHNTHLHAC